MKHDIVIVGLKVIADVCGTSPNTVRRWVREEQFPATKIDSVWRIVPEDLKQWFSERAKQPQNTPRNTP